MFRVYDRSGRQFNTQVKVKPTSKGAYDTSVEVYNTCLGVYDRSGGQANTSGTTKSTSNGPYGTSIDVYNTCLGVYD